MEQRLLILKKLSSEAVNLDTHYTLATGELTKRVYLDSTASTLQLKVVHEVLEKYQPYYSNTHSESHFGAKLSTGEYQWAHQMVLDFVQADPEIYTAFFAGSGATSGLNRVASTLAERNPKRDVVITTVMEHHSNDLPHRKQFQEVIHIPAAMSTNSVGCVNLHRLEEALEEYSERVNYVAITGVSNVTGIINPIHEVAELAHRHGALVVIDAAQMAAHLPIRMSGNESPEQDLDVVVFSGHKIYAPGSPGVVITRKELFAEVEPQEIGGGVVDDVAINRYIITDKFPDREEAGTPNILGAIGLAAALYALQTVGMDLIAQEECRLINYALDKLKTVDNLVIYGETDCTKCQRTGAVSFNLKTLDHALVASVLNDYFNIAVRNHCFCAHPYVREMITQTLLEEADHLTEDELEKLAEMHRGMVRASFGIYSTEEHVDALTEALKHISANTSFYREHYQLLPCGNFRHKSFDFDHTQIFSIKGAVDQILNS
ncbi:MAG: aminotransferase class V-fold PLP-dependent enzyme [SAR324 cluster bacterium]|nr:aminotransferase class V-fold PLP-dependent enzyme [SAR324 cluster bacterium]